MSLSAFTDVISQTFENLATERAPKRKFGGAMCSGVCTKQEKGIS